ncbi:unnamed protein product [Rotaria sordida]|uniref:Uncharacterized protein n=1 Tax=Rotaria sordida TaxID=392033 RepID=A0A813QBF4_9BILA|nr:unnamed protein product [Rotaria sordida]CAF0770698.1 unnamed protein product [Rotaria sordida]CAF0779985.1 unnamed protein product [Rotaria sordida]CAF3523994.1 unnamed protein product [Rotaria sordida]
MAKCENFDITNERAFSVLSQSIAELQSLGSDVGIERKARPASMWRSERSRSMNNDRQQEGLPLIKQTTDIARRAMNLIVNCVQLCALYASRRSRCFSSFSSAISYIREQRGLCKPAQHLLLQWQRNVMLIDLFINNEGLYCNRRIAQDMFDVCMETFDWLRSISNNNK